MQSILSILLTRKHVVNRVFALCVLSLSLASSAATAKIVEYPLSQMVQESNIILVGSVVRIVEEAGDQLHRGQATIDAEQIIKGSQPEAKIIVSYTPGLSVSAHFDIGYQYILFIKQREGKNVIVQGYAGAIPITDGKLRVLFILGEEESQTLDGFIRRIRSMESGALKNKD